MVRPIKPAQPLVPLPTPVAEAFRSSQVWQQLAARLQEAQSRLAIVHALLPASLQPHVKTGGVDEDHWTLLVPSAAMAAKLRQWLPALQTELRQAGFKELRLQIRILPTSP